MPLSGIPHIKILMMSGINDKAPFIPMLAVNMPSGGFKVTGCKCPLYSAKGIYI